MNNPIRVDVSKRTITVMSKPFAAKAFRYGTTEYEQLRTVRADFPDFVVTVRQIRKNSAQEHYKGLTYEFMRNYIAAHDADAMADFDEMVLISKAHSVGYRYPTIKAWFLNRFPEVSDFWIAPSAGADSNAAETADNATPAKTEVEELPITEAEAA